MPARISRRFRLDPGRPPDRKCARGRPGTVEAQESVIANSVPQIATVKRSAARLEITYDGAPEFRPSRDEPGDGRERTGAGDPRGRAHLLRAGQRRVVLSESANGPWIAATSVPPVIYTIPRSHPLHYVTYVRVYDAVGDEVYVGYTPGYVGSYVTPESTVVYGTGWYYTPWIGTVWYAPPVTWGYGFSFYYSWWNPWPWRAWWPAWRPVPCFRPAWGPWPYAHVGVKTFGVAVVTPVGPRGHGHGAVVMGGRISGRSAFLRESRDRGRYLLAAGTHTVYRLTALRRARTHGPGRLGLIALSSPVHLLSRTRWASIAGGTQPMVRRTPAAPGRCSALGEAGGPSRPTELMGSSCAIAIRTAQCSAAARGATRPRTGRHGPAAIAGSVARRRSNARQCRGRRAALALTRSKWPIREPTTVAARRRQMGASRQRLVAGAGSAGCHAGHAARHATTTLQSPCRGRHQGRKQDA